MAGVCEALLTTPSMEVGFREGVGKGGGGKERRMEGGNTALSSPGEPNLRRSKEVICLTPVEEIGQRNWKTKLPR